MHKFAWLRILVHFAALLPLVVLIWDFSQGQLSVNPIQEIQLRTGKSSLVLLVLSLVCTPVSQISGIRAVLLLRRPLGLYAFMYALLHFLNFVGLDYGFNFGLLWEDIAGKRFVLAGFAAFLSLLILAVTSMRWWVKRLGENWERLHRLAYVAGVLAVTHFLWQVKVDFREPLLYGAVVVLLLAARLPAVKNIAGKFRHWFRVNWRSTP